MKALLTTPATTQMRTEVLMSDLVALSHQSVFSPTAEMHCSAGSFKGFWGLVKREPWQMRTEGLLTTPATTHLRSPPVITSIAMTELPCFAGR